jgi:hypothetical protein
MQMGKKQFALVVGLAVAAGACTGVEHLVAPGEAQYQEHPVLPPDGGSPVPQDDPPADTTSERWGGYLGGGG